LNIPAAEIAIALSDLFKDRSTDLHTAAGRAILTGLAETFPEAGIGLGGSVARGTHRSDSDIDVLVSDFAFDRDVQLSARTHGVKVAVLFLRAAGRPERVRRWELQAHGERRLITLVRTASILRDPRGALACIRDEAETAAQTSSDDRGLADALRGEARRMAVALRAAPESVAPTVAARLAILLLETAMVRGGATSAHAKEEERTRRAVIATEHPALYALLRCATHPDHRDALLAAAETL